MKTLEQKIAQIISDSLSVDLNKVVPAATLEDLGADSLDLLDLTFQLEQEFKVKISPREIERRSREQLGETPLEVDGIYTPEALMELRKALPEVPMDELADGLSVGDLPRRFRVATMVNLVCRLLEEKDE